MYIYIYIYDTRLYIYIYMYIASEINAKNLEIWTWEKSIAHWIVLGKGVWPETDAWGQPFGPCAPKHWRERAGQQICGPFRAVVDGFHGDQDFMHKLFEFKRILTAMNQFKVLTVHVWPHSAIMCYQVANFLPKEAGTASVANVAHIARHGPTFYVSKFGKPKVPIDKE